jgi:mannan endo-1,4-beta-mannosidase
MKLQGRTAVLAIASLGLAAAVTAAAAGIISSRFHRTAAAPPSPPQAAQQARAHAHVITTQPTHFLGVSEEPLGTFNQDAGVKANLSVYYLTFGRPFPLHTVRFNARAGALTLLEIEPRTVAMSDIAAGRYDTWLRYLASSVKLSGDKVLLSFAPEANGAWYPWGHTQISSATFIAAWRHVHQVVGTHSVLWVWQMSPYDPRLRMSNPRRLWPGKREADIVGLDGYYYTPGATFNGVFGRTIRYLRAFTKAPVLITETSVGPKTRRQAADIKALFHAVRSWSLLGLVWFDLAQHRGILHQDWRFQDSPAAWAAFRKAAAQYMAQG